MHFRCLRQVVICPSKGHRAVFPSFSQYLRTSHTCAGCPWSLHSHISLKYILNHLLQICPTMPLQPICLSPCTAILGLHHTALLLQQHYHAQRLLMLQLVFKTDAIIRFEHGLVMHFRCLRTQVATFLFESYQAVACVFLELKDF